MPNQELENENYIAEYEHNLVVTQSQYEPHTFAAYHGVRGFATQIHICPQDGELGRGPIWRLYNEFIYDYDEYLDELNPTGCDLQVTYENLGEIFHDGIFLSQFARKIQRCWFNREELPTACPCPESP
tara:strand:+ start:196 stop:579 length:384 start_codon:yes stop_codon:yes gene_type:complete